MKKAVVIGATSAIGQELVKLLCTKNQLYLTGRDSAKLLSVVEDARVRGGNLVEYRAVDFSSEEGVDSLEAWLREMGGFSNAFILPGVLSNEDATFSEWHNDLKVNYLSPCYFSRLLCDLLSEEGGALVVVGSVAGDRGRQSNGLYGSQKSALETYLLALRHKMHGRSPRVSVAVAKPGFVNSPMTAGMPKSFLFSEPEKIAKGLLKRAEKRRSGSFYLPSWWWWILLVVRWLPDFVFLRTKL
ncbi:SDR family NAD(P)-dependent oxidoreductase [Roseibacillus persicicus]|uniref:SDR family NAD(P)-dependent oxidoreductase n=1 Tax=Roseibacillus persicicus TaxID=454148 RepID=UPI00280E570B|nr:SDR family NAD(P)-dependent oxidoreductase [Roseibacillus persicicus]MDQ8188870.1 SDR family NAD(P)-dependent oxidoreductase [Roseibacillus persicicus]